jgi:hypothetical protein
MSGRGRWIFPVLVILGAHGVAMVGCGGPQGGARGVTNSGDGAGAELSPPPAPGGGGEALGGQGTLMGNAPLADDSLLVPGDGTLRSGKPR